MTIRGPAPKYNYFFPGDKLPPTPEPKNVSSPKLRAATVALYETVAENWTGVNRDERYAPPHRQAILDKVDGLVKSFKSVGSQESDALKQAVRALRDFRKDNPRSGSEGDPRVQLRLFFGYSATRPGYRQLMDDVFVAAGMGKASSYTDVSPN